MPQGAVFAGLPAVDAIPEAPLLPCLDEALLGVVVPGVHGRPVEALGQRHRAQELLVHVDHRAALVAEAADGAAHRQADGLQLLIGDVGLLAIGLQPGAEVLVLLPHELVDVVEHVLDRGDVADELDLDGAVLDGVLDLQQAGHDPLAIGLARAVAAKAGVAGTAEGQAAVPAPPGRGSWPRRRSPPGRRQ